MIGSANDTSAQRVHLRDELGLISDDGMAITSVRLRANQTGGGPYRGSALPHRGSTFHVVEVGETTVAVVPHAPTDPAVRGQITQALLQRHAVVVFIEAEVLGAAAASVASRSLELPAAVMIGGRAAAALKAIGRRDPSPGFVFVIREAGPRRAEPHHLCVRAFWSPPHWRATAARPAHEWDALRSRFGRGAVVGVDIEGTRAFLRRKGQPATDLMLARVELALRLLAGRSGATFARGRGDEFVFATEYAEGPPLGEAALRVVRDLAIPNGAGRTLEAQVGVIAGAPAATVTARLEAAVRGSSAESGVQIHLG